MDDEVERRRAADFAICSVRLSGFTLDDAARAQFELYVQEKITTDEMRANCLARHGIKTAL